MKNQKTTEASTNERNAKNKTAIAVAQASDSQQTEAGFKDDGKAASMFNFSGNDLTPLDEW